MTITALCNRDAGRAKMIMDKFAVAGHYTDYREMLEKEKPDFVDIITPPPTYREMSTVAADLGGEIAGVYAVLKKLNPVIAGEDFAVVVFNFVSGATGVWDANRYNESNYPKPRYTFGEFLVEGNSGSIRLYNDARLTIQKLGQPEKEHGYPHENRNFCGDRCHTT